MKKEEVKEVKYHKVEINFDKLIENEKNKTIKSMHEYFKNVDASKYNEYTGMFEGKKSYCNCCRSISYYGN